MNTSNKRFMEADFPASVLVTLFCLYPILTKTGLNLIVCTPVGPRSFLSADFSIQCNPETADYTLWRNLIGIPSIILFSIGVPFGYGFQVYRGTKAKEQHHILTEAGRWPGGQNEQVTFR